MVTIKENKIVHQVKEPMDIEQKNSPLLNVG